MHTKCKQTDSGTDFTLGLHPEMLTMKIDNCASTGRSLWIVHLLHRHARTHNHTLFNNVCLPFSTVLWSVNYDKTGRDLVIGGGTVKKALSVLLHSICFRIATEDNKVRMKKPEGEFLSFISLFFTTKYWNKKSLLEALSSGKLQRRGKKCRRTGKSQMTPHVSVFIVYTMLGML